MSSTSSRSHRLSSISPFRSRKSPSQQPPPSKPPSTKSLGRPTTPSSVSTSSRPPSRLSESPVQSQHDRTENCKAKENVTVTVRFRPLSAREISKGDEIGWYADGDYTVRNEYNSSIAYGFDRVFGPATTTRRVYDVAAQHVVGGAMQGINGTVFAYGVTSSGKTHTMHGEQKSPGIIPLAIKDVFGIIQETPGREFLLRVSYLEIYNEVINNLLDPTGQNLKIREDAQGTYVEGIKDEVVLSPAHALSLIAAGEAHRHVGSNNFNILSSRSHTIFTLTIESSPRGECQGEEDVTLSQLHLIDLAGSESSKTETTGLRRKEGSYINKSLLTLGTVISKLTDGKATHIPYRDSKLTRLLQSSLSGHGRISLICTLTPASSNSEETHNTLKFAHRSKHVEIKASQNKIMDEKSLIKKYQKEISCLKEELQQLKRGMMQNPYMAAASTQEDLVNLKLQLEAGQVKLQSRLEEEEQAKAALMGRIQRLTKLILVSTKNSMQSSLPERSGHRRRHSFGEDELAYLPDRKREYVVEEDAKSYISELSEGRDDLSYLDDLVNDYKRNRRRGMLGWFRMKKPDNMVGSSTADSVSSTSGSPSSCSKSSQCGVTFSDTKDGHRKSVGRKRDDSAPAGSFPERTQAGELFSAATGNLRLPPTGTTITDQMDLLREQIKMLAGDVALCTSSLKRLSEQAARNPEDLQLKEQMQKLKIEIRDKKLQMRVLEQRMVGSLEINPHASNSVEMAQALSKLTTQLNEKTFELEIKTADNRILQEQLQKKVAENTDMEETILQLRQQLNSLVDKSTSNQQEIAEPESHIHKICSEEKSDFLNSQLLMRAAEIENLKQEKNQLIEEKEGLYIQSQKLAEEASYAKELAAAAAVELRNLAEEVTQLSYENAKLSGDLAASKDQHFRSNGGSSYGHGRQPEDSALVQEMQKQLNLRYEREASVKATLSEKDKIESELRARLDEARRHEQDLENEIAGMRKMVAKMRKSGTNTEDITSEGLHTFNVPRAACENVFRSSNGHSSKASIDQKSENMADIGALADLKASYQKERERCKELEGLILRLKGEDIGSLDLSALEKLQNFHVEAITRICEAKCATNIL